MCRSKAARSRSRARVGSWAGPDPRRRRPAGPRAASARRPATRETRAATIMDRPERRGCPADGGAGRQPGGCGPRPGRRRRPAPGRGRNGADRPGPGQPRAAPPPGSAPRPARASPTARAAASVTTLALALTPRINGPESTSPAPVCPRGTPVRRPARPGGRRTRRGSGPRWPGRRWPSRARVDRGQNAWMIACDEPRGPSSAWPAASTRWGSRPREGSLEPAAPVPPPAYDRQPVGSLQQHGGPGQGGRGHHGVAGPVLARDSPRGIPSRCPPARRPTAAARRSTSPRSAGLRVAAATSTATPASIRPGRCRVRAPCPKPKIARPPGVELVAQPAEVARRRRRWSRPPRRSARSGSSRPRGTAAASAARRRRRSRPAGTGPGRRPRWDRALGRSRPSRSGRPRAR